MNKILFLFLFFCPAISCNDYGLIDAVTDTPTPCDCMEILNKGKDQVTVKEMEILTLHCLDGAMYAQFIDPDKPFQYAIDETRKYIQENCPEYSQKSPD